MRLSRVLLAGVAIAGVAATTSAFTASNNFSGVDNNVAGYGEMIATGVAVNNIAYTPVTGDGSRLQTVAFTVDRDTASMSARMTLFLGTTPITDGASTCTPTSNGTTHLITCTLTNPPLITAFDKTSLTVTSN